MSNADDVPTAMSSDYDWDLVRVERNIDTFRLYDVQKAKQIIVDTPRAVQEIDLNQHGDTFREFLAGVKLKENADWDTVNADVPVIFMQTQEGRTPIDGRHRLHKALAEGRSSLKAIFLTSEETDAIRLA